MTLIYDKSKADSAKKIDAHGYLYFCDIKHPLAYKSNSKVIYHRHVTSLKEGRWINGDEHVHHIDGDKQNNSPENLAIVSRSEHAIIHNGKTRPIINCATCGKESRNNKYCSYKCTKIGLRRAEWPDANTLKELLNSMSCSRIAKMFNVSDNAVKKWAKSMGLETKPVGYWARKAAGKL